MRALIVAILFSFQPDSVVGTWVNIDDKTGVEKSEIILYVEDGNCLLYTSPSPRD